MKKIKDFFYNCNDIIVVCIIIILAGLLIYWRVGKIMDYPRVLADEISARGTSSDEIHDPAVNESNDGELQSETSDSQSNTENSDSLPSTIWEDGKLKSNMEITIPQGSEEAAVQSMVDIGLFSSFDDYYNACERNGIDPAWIQASTYSLDKGSTQDDIVHIVTAR